VPAGWDIRLFGAFELRIDDRPLPAIESIRVRSLLSRLLLQRDVAVSRERLAAALWPESTEAQARTNLRHLLHTLRRAVPETDQRLVVTAAALTWRTDTADTLDVAEFERLRSITGSGRVAALRRAADVYRGDLLEGVDDEWVRADRDRLRADLAEILRELADSADDARAVRDAERLLQLDPLRESSYRLLMRVHAALGDRAAAVRVFHRCSEILGRELDVRPSAETEAVYRALLPGLDRAAPTTTGRQSPLVGRDSERARLVKSWRSALGGHARLVLLAGDPGVGKSRLAADFRAWSARQGAAVAVAACHAAEGPLPFGVVTTWLRSPALRAVLPTVDRERRRDLARLLPELLAEDPALPGPTTLPEDEQRPRVFDAVAIAIDRIVAASGPVLLVVDDLHHADRESCRLLHYLLRVRADSRLLIVATARRDELDRSPARELLLAARSRDRLERIDVGPLTPAETGALIARMTGGDVADDDARRLHERTAGNPLFVVEAIRAGWTAGAARVPVTPRVRAVLESRIDGLGPVGRQLAAAGAVIGRPFDADLLFAVARESSPVSDDLIVGLDELWRRGIVADRGGAGTYDFTHEALRDVALAETGPVLLAALHRRVAGLLVRRGAAEGSPAEIAAHHAHGGEPTEAVPWYRRAAESAQGLYAHAEAIRLLDRAVEAARTTDRPDALELELRTAQLGSLVPEHGYASPQVAAVQERALALTESLAARPSAPLLRSLAMTALTADDFVAARSYADRLRATRDQSGILAVEADVLLGFAAFWSADFRSARDHFDSAVRGYRPANTAAHLAGYGQDPKAVALARLANTRWFLDDPAGASRARDEALAWAEQVRHPYTRTAVLLFATLLDIDMHDESAARRHANALIGLGPVAPPLRLSTDALAGLLSVLDGRPEDGLTAIRRAIAANRSRAGAPGMRAILGRIQLAAAAATGDSRLLLAAADAMLAAGPAGAVWAPEARRMRSLQPPTPGPGTWNAAGTPGPAPSSS
jgi:DNA-binding SARP family transcriptional activator